MNIMASPETVSYTHLEENYIDKELEANMENVLKLVVMGRACRNTANIKNRQPIGQMFVKAAFTLPDFYQQIVLEELNVKQMKFTDDVRDFTSYTFKPQLKTVGPKYGKMLGGIRAALDEVDGNAAMDEVCLLYTSWKPFEECKGRRELDCDTDGWSRYESRT